ncbi:MAG: bifunctional phosphoribosylaminoimidazolecarboxamide formyltransferase/IMP cyclohydrolase [Spirochaetales bacterium]|nr:bifunctional phosphoribosylaminoimidazolecarboxamide formyltransferase/IMP cyclohydrolase [Spirochaetales bacterium]
MIRRALISVYKKEGVAEFARFLEKKGYEVVSTGGTLRHLKEEGLQAIDISDVTGFPEMMDGRVKTLHPMVHGGLLGIRDNEEHQAVMREYNISPIDVVVVNLYPFFEEVRTDKTFEEKIEFIDIGGPTMLRSAAKNFRDVVVVTDPSDYKGIMEEMEQGDVSFETKKRCAGKVFNLTSAYDGAISQFLLGDDALPEYFQASYKKVADLRYGENPHQKAAYYGDTRGTGALAEFEQLNGKELSFNNIRDMDVAWKVVCEFDEIVCCGLKHSTPCGVATGKTVDEAYLRAHDCDPVSIFGGIVAVNQEVNKAMAEELIKIFLEIVIAPSFSAEALEVLKGKKNLRVIKAVKKPEDIMEVVNVDGGVLVQNNDKSFAADSDMKVVTKAQPSKEQMADMIFGQKVVKHVKSNAIVVVKDGCATGIGGGQTNRIWAAQQAIERAGDGTVMASDAFFPFDDVVKTAAEAGVKAIIQPGGSIRDEDSVKAADELGLAMVVTGLRHFKH